MRFKLSHPIWTHLPAAAALLFFIYAYLTAQLPASVPVHFDFAGQPDRYGSPWETFGITAGLSLLFIGLSVFLDNLWARQEESKRFNWLSLLDDITVGLLAGINLGYLDVIVAGGETFPFPWQKVLLVGGITIAAAVLLEILRPYRPYESRITASDTSTLAAEMAQRLQKGAPLVYWQSQNPFYVSLLSIGLPLVMLAGAVAAWFDEPWAGLLLLAMAILFTGFYGGLRTIVTRENITIRLGLYGLRVLRLETGEVNSVALHHFSALRDFGGYGIRFNKEMKAYFMNGDRGVKLTTVSGKNYLIGSDHPEKLAAVIGAVTGHEPAMES